MERMMNELFDYISLAIPFLIVLFAWIAFTWRRSQHEKMTGTGAIEAAIFGLLGLLIAFTFAGAYSRFETRRQIIVDEANAIGTAFFRLDLLPADSRPLVQKKMLEYLDSRINFFPKLIHTEEAQQELRVADELQEEIWDLAVAKTQGADFDRARLLLLPALNQMFDVKTTRTLAVVTHTPVWIFLMFFVMVLICSILAGRSMAEGGHFSWLYMTLFALAMFLTINIIIDIEYPRTGLIRLDFVQQAFITLRESMVEHIAKTAEL